MASDLSVRLGAMPPAFVDRIRRLVDRAALPVTAPDWTAERWLELMRSDKKAEGGEIRFVLIESLGRAGVPAHARRSPSCARRWRSCSR